MNLFRYVVLCVFCVVTYADEAPSEHQIPKITVQKSPLSVYDIGNFAITKDFIQNFPSGNGDITSLLKINPNVSFSNTYESSKTPGEIDPANISINGAAFYQNLFNLDGVSMNNDLDPVSSNPNSITDIPGRSQGMGIDSSLIGNIFVYDSNIPANYGGFEGGVIDAQTKNPSKQWSGNISYQTTSSAQTKYHIYDSEYDAFIDSSEANAQPQFFKRIIRANLSGYLGEHFGVITSFSSTHSTIPLKAYIPSYGKQMQKLQHRDIDNYFFKALYDGIENLDLEMSLTYAPQNNQYFIKNAKDSDFSIISGGIQGLLKATYRFQFATFINTLSYSDLKNSREAEKNYFKGWKYSADKDWGTPGKGSNEGSWGNINSTQRSLSYKSDLIFEEFEVFKTSHIVSMGVGLDFVNAFYQRLQDSFSGSSLSPIKTTGVCIEEEWCSNSPVIGEKSKLWKDNAGQYFKWLTLYKAGKINIDNFSYGVYVQDDMNVWRFSLRVGMRVDGDTYMAKSTFAPRVALAFDVFGNKKTSLIAGVNRYYGRNILAYRLNDGKNALQSVYKRSSEAINWSEASLEQSLSNTQFSRLNIPYNDEFVAGITQKFYGLEASLKYIHRNGRDEITKVSSKVASLPSNPNYNRFYSTYTNNGKSRSDIISLNIATLYPLEFLGIRQSFLFGGDYKQIKRNYNHYASALNSDSFRDENIVFNGKIIKYSELPANDFAKPYTLRLTTITQAKISDFSFTWTNFFSYKSGYQAIIQNGVSNIGSGGGGRFEQL